MAPADSDNRSEAARLLLVAVVFGAAWAAAAHRAAAPYILPGPGPVARAFLANGPRLWEHTITTLGEAAGGFAVGFCLAVILGFVAYRSRALGNVVLPYAVASQAVPIVAIAPLLLLWFHDRTTVKVATAAIVVFFPILVLTLSGLKGIDPVSRQLMRALSATSWQRFTKLELPAVLPSMLAGARVGVTLAVIGAVVGEFLGAEKGLGAAIQIARAQFNTPLMFAATFLLVAMALGLYTVAVLVERVALRHRRPSPP